MKSWIATSMAAFAQSDQSDRSAASQLGAEDTTQHEHHGLVFVRHGGRSQSNWNSDCAGPASYCTLFFGS
jgi:hypothetical protein